jgi:DNA-binding protein HU-beta
MEEMNKAALIDKIARDAKITKAAAATAVDSFVHGVTSALKKNQRVTLVGFGTWGVSKRKARTGRNPQTGETIKIKAKKTVRFKAGKQLEEALN